ncbi:MAG TPA: HipA family kinase [Acidobacteriaceae bacterium]|jgi:hypothetical protein|nr:HipA family kinase [Acidobacteriaceae bacterium]
MTEDSACCTSHFPTLHAIKPLRKLNGSSQPSLVLADDGRSYIVKFREFTGLHGLMNEALGAELMRCLGLPVPRWRPLNFTDSFLDRHPQLWYRSRAADPGIRPRAGLHFGSLLVDPAPGQSVYQVIPPSWIPRVANRQDFVGALLLDLWTNQCDRRQCLFVAQPGDQSLQAVFIDNDHLFGGDFGDEKTCARRAMLRNLQWYRAIWTDPLIALWMDRITSIDRTALDAIFRIVPSAWANQADLVNARMQLERRHKQLELFVEDISEVLRDGHCLSMSGTTCNCQSIVAESQC